MLAQTPEVIQQSTQNVVNSPTPGDTMEDLTPRNYISQPGNEVIKITYDWTKPSFSQKRIGKGKSAAIVLEDNLFPKVLLRASGQSQTFSQSTPAILTPIIGNITTGAGYNLTENPEFERIDSIKIKFMELIYRESVLLYNEKDYHTENILSARAKISFDTIISYHNNNFALSREHKGIEFLEGNYESGINGERPTGGTAHDTLVLKSLEKIVTSIQEEYRYYGNAVKNSRIFLPEDAGKTLLLLLTAQSPEIKYGKNSFDFLKRCLEWKNETESNPINAGKDNTKLTVALLNPITYDTLHSDQVDLITTDKWQLSFSTGMFLNSLVEDKYYVSIDTASDATNNTLIAEYRPNDDVALGALMHYSYRASGAFGLGLNLGAALSPFDGNTRYMVGGSFLFGRKTQAVVSVGYALSRLNVLSNQVQNLSGELLVPKTVTTVPLQKKWEDGWYVGVSYTIFKVK